MKPGDIVVCPYPDPDHPPRKNNDKPDVVGVIVGFNKKGEGGHDFVHVLVDNKVHVYMFCDLEVIKK